MAMTFLLSDSWDLQTDLSGNIAMTFGAYAICQNVANAIRLFTRDAYFDQDRGIPHFQIELGKKPPLSLLRSRVLQAAKSVEGVADAIVAFDSFEDRELGGTVEITTTDGEKVSVEF